MTEPSLELIQKKKSEDKLRLANIKAVSEQIKHIFFSPFSRMMRYFYTGVSLRSDVFILGTDEEEDFRYGNPDQGLALVHLKDPVLKSTILAWFQSLGVDIDKPEMICLAEVSAILNKCKWDITRVVSSRNQEGDLVLTIDTGESKQVSIKIDTFFAFQKIKHLSESYISALVEKSTLVYDHPYLGDPSARLSKVVIDIVPLREKGFHNLPELGHVRVILRRGLDWIDAKNLAPCSDDGVYWIEVVVSIRIKFLLHVCLRFPNTNISLHTM